MTATVRDARPPAILVRVLNPVMRVVLRSPLGRFVQPLALLEFSGRRTGRRYLVPVGWHEANARPVVFTPAPWRANFREPADVTVHHGGRARSTTADVAEALRSVVAETSPRAVGLDVPAGHVLSADDVIDVDRAMLRFDV